MHLIYGGFEIRSSEMRTTTYSADPVLDQSGLDILYHRVTIECVAVVNPLRMATNQAAVLDPNKPPAATLGATLPGDRLGITINNIQQEMGNPRQKLRVYCNNDLILESPARAADATDLPCDLQGGPIVRDIRFTPIIGDKTALLRFRIETAISPCAKWLLSNRWRVSSHTDSSGYTTRTVTGIAKFNLAAMARGPTSPDGFRRFLIVPTDNTMRRTGCNVTVNERGDELAYTVTDREITYGCGNRIERVEGTATTGARRKTPMPTAKEAAKAALSPVDTMMNVTWFGVRMALPILWLFGGNPVLNKVKESLPDCTANMIVRVYGQKDATRETLFNVAMSVIEDRFEPLWAPALFDIISLYVTQWVGSEDQPKLEVRVELLPTSLAEIKSFVDVRQVKKIMKLDPRVTVSAADPPPTKLPSSENTRGSWIGQLAVQTLMAGSTPCAVPASPPAAANAVEADRAV